MSVSLLLIEDSEYDAELTERALQKSDFDFTLKHITQLSEVENELRVNCFDVIISDYNLVGFSGEDTLNIAQELRPETPFIIQSGEINKELEVTLLKNDVTDVVLKRNLDRLPFAVKRALKEKNRKEELLQNLAQQKALADISQLLDGEGPINVKLQAILKRLGAASDASRAFIFENSEARQVAQKTYEWVSGHVDEESERIEKMAFEDISGWETLIDKNNSLNAPNINVLPESFRELLASHGIKSILISPIIISGKQYGFIGMSDVRSHRRWSDYQVSSLVTVAGFIANVIKETRYLDNLERSNKMLQEALDEKTVLIGEIHHRVKNNLALISAFSELKRLETDNDEVYSALTSHIIKIKNIAQIQELIYKTDSFSRVPVYPVIRQLIELLSLETDGKVDYLLKEGRKDIVLNINQVTPFALLVSELLLFFKTERQADFVRENEIKIKLSFECQEDRFIFNISNYVFIRFFEKIESLESVSMVAYSLKEQINANLDLFSSSDTLRISFKIEEMKGSASSL